MRMRVGRGLTAMLAALAVAGLAVTVGAQGPPPPGDLGGGPPPGPMMEGMVQFGGLMGAFGGKTVTGKPLQANFTSTRVEALPGNSITNTMTGTVARDSDGSIYRDVKFTSIGPWAASGKPREITYIRNIPKGMQYLVNVTKQTYQAFPIGNHNGAWKQRVGGQGSNAANETVTDNSNATYTDPATNAQYKVDDRKVTRTIPAGQIGNERDLVITIERWYSPDLDVVLQETRSDPRFGTTTYQLTNIIQQPQASLFVPNPAFTQVQGEGFGRHGAAKPVPPPQTPD